MENHFALHALEIDRTDGISMTFPQWRFNLRSSNTEPVVRLNVESRADAALDGSANAGHYGAVESVILAPLPTGEGTLKQEQR
ncbi:phosphomannomutase CpsG [Leclercia adecarboxylata]|uniref:Phosphomannomutase CpsG n=1 Tax=Leclercia adecarboxylata TaxID=83655 RepID=A0A4U9I700_9ENTR|nr:phosphomannomutase CpsG [Leclercia adecarboxylata]